MTTGILHRRLPAWAGLLLFLCSGAAHALGLGQATVQSYLQQPLDARIDLISRSEAELATVTAGLATAADFRVMGLSSSAVGLPLEFTVVRTIDDPHIRVRSTVPVQDPVMQIVVEVVWASGRMLRQYTLFLDPPTFQSVAPAPSPRGRRTTEPVVSAAPPAQAIDRSLAPDEPESTVADTGPPFEPSAPAPELEVAAAEQAQPEVTAEPMGVAEDADITVDPTADAPDDAEQVVEPAADQGVAGPEIDDDGAGLASTPADPTEAEAVDEPSDRVDAASEAGETEAAADALATTAAPSSTDAVASGADATDLPADEIADETLPAAAEDPESVPEATEPAVEASDLAAADDAGPAEEAATPPAVGEPTEEVAAAVEQTPDASVAAADEAPETSGPEAPAPPEESAPEVVFRSVVATPAEVGVHTVQRGETLWSLSRTWARERGLTVQQMMLAVQEANPSAFRRDNINVMMAGAVLRIPDGSQASFSQREALLEVMRQEQLYRNQWVEPTAPEDLPSIADVAQQPGATAEVAASGPPPTPDEGRLELVPPAREEEPEEILGQGSSGELGVEEGEGVVEELARAQEELANLRQENAYLAERIDELEAELARSRESPDEGVADTGLAELEDRLRTERLEGEAEEPQLAPAPEQDGLSFRVGAWVLGTALLAVIAGLVFWLRFMSRPLGRDEGGPGDPSGDPD